MNEIRIDDLRHPRRSPDEQALYDLSREMQVELSVDGVLTEARAEAGLVDLGGTGVAERLAVQVGAVNADGGLSGIGRHVVKRRLVGLVAARLRFEDFVLRHPEAAAVELAPPVIVVGLPRSGTTHLVNLLAADTRFRSMPWWEVRDPPPCAVTAPGPTAWTPLPALPGEWSRPTPRPPWRR